MAATALTGRGLLMAVRGHEEDGGGDSEGRGRENGHAEEGVPARVPYGGFVVPAVPVELARCPVCHSGAFTIKRQPAMAVASPPVLKPKQEQYIAWLHTPIEQRGACATMQQYAEARGVSLRTLYRWGAMEGQVKITPEQRHYYKWAASLAEDRPEGEKTVEQYAAAHGISSRTLYRWSRGEEAKRPYVTVPCPETAVVSCFTCGRDYLEYERGSREGWRKRPVRRWDGVILNDW